MMHRVLVLKQNNQHIKQVGYRYGGGEQKINEEKNETKKYFDEYPEIKDFILEYYDIHFKDSMRGSLADDALIEAVKVAFGIELNKIYLKYL